MHSICLQMYIFMYLWLLAIIIMHTQRRIKKLSLSNDHFVEINVKNCSFLLILLFYTLNFRDAEMMISTSLDSVCTDTKIWLLNFYIFHSNIARLSFSISCSLNFQHSISQFSQFNDNRKKKQKKIISITFW